MLFFEQTIKNNLGPFKNVKRSVPSVKSAIYIWFQEVLGSKNWGEENMLMSQKVFMNEKNRGHFEKILSSAIDTYVSVKEQEVRERIEESEQRYPFELRPELFFNEYTDEKVRTKKYAYEPCYLDINRSAPEKKFEEFLDDNSSKIDWWWKNGENKLDYFGIKYEYQNSIYTFYPDYLVKFNDGRVAVLEVKETNDRDGLSYTRAKAEALQKYIKKLGNKKLFGGIVIERNDTWSINDKQKYDWDKCEKGDWKDWIVFKLMLS
jgi:type III restriction enzyme